MAQTRSEVFPGVGRERSPFKSDSFPTVAREALDSATQRRAPFPFESWAAANRFEYPREFLPLLCRCESAAEVYLAREIVRSPGADAFDSDGVAFVGFDSDPNLTVGFQFPTPASRIDFVVYDDSLRCKLAIEVDGIGFHHRSKEQIAADYLRERRLVLLGFSVVRFTAQEAFAVPAECWRQILEIVAAHRRRATEK